MPQENSSGQEALPAVEAAAGPEEGAGNNDGGRRALEEAVRPLNERITLLEQDLASKEQEIQRQSELVHRQEAGLNALNARHEAAVAAYRGALVRANPLIPAELINGGSVEELDGSLQRAAGLVSHIRQGLELQQKVEQRADVIPAGAPGRVPPDMSGMSAREKIAYGLEQTRQNR